MIKQKIEQVFTYDEIYRGYKRSRRAKRSRKQIIRFELTTCDRIYGIYKGVASRDFSFGEYHTFVVHQPKRREIQTLRYDQRILQHVLCDKVLMPYFSKRVIEDNCVCQEGKGAHYALSRFEKSMRAYIRENGCTGYVLKCDVLKYFPCISHEVLKQQICQQIADKDLRAFVENVIDSYHTSPEYLHRYNVERLEFDGQKTGRGVPIGNQTSQVFGMFYLNQLDRIIKEKYRIKIYSRYMDDFVIVHKDKKQLQNLLQVIKSQLALLKLTLNSRTQIFPIKNGLTYLGFRYQVTSGGKLIKKVSKRTKKRFRKRSHLIELAYRSGLIEKERVRQSVSAYHGHLKHGNCHTLERKTAKNLRKILEEEDGK